MMAIKTVNSLSHYTDWTIAHVHSGSLGWVAMITIGSLYAMAPRALGRPAMYSRRGMEVHFWLHLIGTLFYVIAMWIAGVTEGTMWRATNPDGALTYSFLDSLIAIRPLYMFRWFGGVLIWLGMWVMAWNLWYTAADARKPIISPIPVPIPDPEPRQTPAPLPATY
jgi:cytochrome c oxidase cbb3-type subunit 1